MIDNIRTSRRGKFKIEESFEILLVENDAEFANALSDYLEGRFLCHVFQARRQSEIVQLLQERPQGFFVAIVSANFAGCSWSELKSLLGQYSFPLLATVDEYDARQRSQLLHDEVCNYVFRHKLTALNTLGDAIERLRKNKDVKVLVVDDSSVSRFVISRILRTQRMQVLTAENGEKGLELIRQYPEICLVMVDQQMPSMDGQTFVSEARNIAPRDRLAIIGISTSHAEETIARFLKCGANDFILKPLIPEALINRVNQNLELVEAQMMVAILQDRDSMTRLYNRRFFFERGTYLLEKSKKFGDPFNLMLLDIHGMTAINDGYGQEAGNQAIDFVAKTLKTYFAEDLLARLSGDKFAIINTRHTSHYFLAYLEEFRRYLRSHPLQFNGQPLVVSCAIGATHKLDINLDETLKKIRLRLDKTKGKDLGYVVVE